MADRSGLLEGLHIIQNEQTPVRSQLLTVTLLAPSAKFHAVHMLEGMSVFKDI